MAAWVLSISEWANSQLLPCKSTTIFLFYVPIVGDSVLLTVRISATFPRFLRYLDELVVPSFLPSSPDLIPLTPSVYTLFNVLFYFFLSFFEINQSASQPSIQSPWLSCALGGHPTSPKVVEYRSELWHSEPLLVGFFEKNV